MQVVDALVRLEVILDPDALALGVDPLEGVRAEAVHVPQGGRASAIAEEPGELMGQFGGKGEEVPDVVRLLHLGTWIGLLGVDEIRKFQRITNEEDGRVVADQIVVSFFGVELQRKTSRIARRVGCALGAGDRGEPGEYLRLLSYLGQEGGSGESRHVVRDHELAVGAAGHRVHDALRNALPIEVRELLDQVMVLEQYRAARTRRLRVLIVDDGRARGGGQDIRNFAEFFRHLWVLFSSLARRCASYLRPRPKWPLARCGSSQVELR